jgi:hypothetical protein
MMDMMIRVSARAEIIMRQTSVEALNVWTRTNASSASHFVMPMLRVSIPLARTYANVMMGLWVMESCALKGLVAYLRGSKPAFYVVMSVAPRIPRILQHSDRS